MARSLRKTKGRAEGYSFVQFQHRMLRSAQFQALRPRSTKALLYLASQYNGSNNGDLSIAWKIAATHGWKSNGSLREAVKELIGAGFVVQTRQGGRNRCSLFALAWFPIDDCNGKLDVAPTRVAPNYWLAIGKSSEPAEVQCAPHVVQSGQIP